MHPKRTPIADKPKRDYSNTASKRGSKFILGRETGWLLRPTGMRWSLGLTRVYVELGILVNRKIASVNQLRMGMVIFVLAAIACAGTATTPSDTQASPTATSASAAATTPAAAGSDITIVSSRLMKDNGSGAAGDVVTAFKSTDHTQYFEAQTSGFLAIGADVTIKFVAVDTDAGKNIAIAQTDVKVLVGNTIDGQLSLPRDFPVGSYRADILVNGALIGSIPYTVEK